MPPEKDLVFFLALVATPLAAVAGQEKDFVFFLDTCRYPRRQSLPLRQSLTPAAVAGQGVSKNQNLVKVFVAGSPCGTWDPGDN